ncbi:phosphate acetyltransferase [Alteromonas macleodii str. 'Black Sea 11']|uniref:phosphate acetyltransferase n=3 Tax=Alteromonas abrolhosensis TaxID=1892904 RepID=UPI000286F41F|nr:phosphate acetyltransferase [Alteromonas abrolhosensis]AFT77935.1 phosphate acetyltransferase [Alteromonas macleodii str. 'Black Sea 11']NKW89055.1 phosphate acetyltransferase [Alteromonadaceae bacterium A_SAG4]NKX35542.1 phosphate acetyltransferase [Alteromonadaceae bacterium A_SAG3]NKX69183.1 phosphate acetyltransferase [Alteromonadaceae bacterium A_SAG7]
MSRRIMLIPVGTSVGLTTVSMGLVRAIEEQGIKLNFYKPVAQPRRGDNGEERSTAIISHHASVTPITPFGLEYVERMISNDNTDELLEEIIERFEKNSVQEAVTVIEGLVTTRHHPYAERLNLEISRALDADIVFVAVPGNDSTTDINHRLEIVVDTYGGHKSQKVVGCIFNKVNAPFDEHGRLRADIGAIEAPEHDEERTQALRGLPIFKKGLSLLGNIDWSADLVSPRATDVAKHLNASLINEGELAERRLSSVTFCAREIHNMTHTLKPGALLVMSGDRGDVFVSCCLAALNGTKLGALLLTGGYQPDENIMALCRQAMETGLPVMLVNSNTWQTAQALHAFNQEVPVDDSQRIEKVMVHTAESLDASWVNSLTQKVTRQKKLSPSAFRFYLTNRARQVNKRIVLPEGNEPRTVVAASICAKRGLARPVLLGDETEIRRVAEQQGVVLSEGVEILSPSAIKKDYVEGLVALRGHKGVTEVVARELLEDNVTLGTMMLQQGDVDGLVSGAVNTTANTIRPALQLIKTAENASLVSSVFFMLLPDQVLVYGDCAINPDPDAKQLADIAIQSAESAQMFGIEPRVAMISYSTGSSGAGSDVEKVREATKIAQSLRPDLLIDGPLQYDAAAIESVGKSKAPNSPVAGKANVFVFPDLNTGNTTYKAVQRSFDLVCIGPMLQGMRKPVNDLSRGALVDDIVFTIALTAIQAAGNV